MSDNTLTDITSLRVLQEITEEIVMKDMETNDETGIPECLTISKAEFVFTKSVIPISFGIHNLMWDDGGNSVSAWGPEVCNNLSLF